MKKIGSLLGLGVLTLLLGACGAPGRGSAAQTPAVREFFAMDTFMSVQVWGAGGEAAAAALQTETVRLEGGGRDAGAPVAGDRTGAGGSGGSPPGCGRDL